MDGDGCPLIDELRNTASNMRAYARGLDALFRRYSESGRMHLPTDLFHEVDKNEGIWEFIKGRLRVFCFVAPDDGSVLILSHHIVKQTQKTQKADIEAAIRTKKSYVAAQIKGQVEFLSEE